MELIEKLGFLSEIFRHMNFRIFSLSVLTFLAACNNSDPQVTEGTFEIRRDPS